MIRDWGSSHIVGCVYFHPNSNRSYDKGPNGPCLVLCTAHSGDNFYDYRILHVNGTKARLGGEFSTYGWSRRGWKHGKGTIPDPFEVAKLTKKYYHLLLADEEIEVSSYLTLINKNLEILGVHISSEEAN